MKGNKIEAFKKLEIKHDLFDLKIKDLFIWERIRHDTWKSIQSQTSKIDTNRNSKNQINKYINSFALLVKNFLFKNPFFTQKSDIMFVGHPRRKRLDDGMWWDIYCDPIHEHLSEEYSHFEHSHDGKHYSPTPTPNIRYLDLIKNSGLLQQKLSRDLPQIPSCKKKKLNVVSEEIGNELGVSVDLTNKTKVFLQRRDKQLWLYERLLQKIDPSIVVLVVSYNNSNDLLIEACKNLGIPTAELQHGIIYDYHFAYSYPGPRAKHNFPDYFLTFGDFWSEQIEFPLPDDRMISVGYPHLERSVNQTSNQDKDKNKILFISQDSIGTYLSKFAIEFDRYGQADHNIVYKLHPEEDSNWKKDYPWLANSELTVVDSTGPSLYELFSESQVQIGVYSTAIYEGLAYELETYIYDTDGSEILKPLIKRGSAQLVSSPNELCSLIGSGNNSLDVSYYFRRNSIKRVREILDMLLENATQNRISE